MAIDHEILMVKEVSELLKIHESTVYKMIREGRIPAFKIGSDWRFLKDQIVRGQERWDLVMLPGSLYRRRSVKQGCRSRFHAGAALSLAILSRL
jgi:excisionase family DNA binding protein